MMFAHVKGFAWCGMDYEHVLAARAAIVLCVRRAQGRARLWFARARPASIKEVMCIDVCVRMHARARRSVS